MVRRDSPSVIYAQLMQDFSKDVLNFSLIDIFVLQRLAKQSQPIVRYQLMKEVKDYIPSLSIAKFYRILDKLVRIGLASFTEKNNEKLYTTTNEGKIKITTLSELLIQPGINVLQYFQQYQDRIADFVFDQDEHVLVRDYEGFVELPFIQIIGEYSSYVSLIEDNEVIEWMMNSIPNLKPVAMKNGDIREPDESFDKVILFYPLELTNEKELGEYLRILKKDGYLVVYESEPVKPDHYVMKILFDAYAPSMYRDRNDPSALFDRIERQYDWQNMDELTIDGLVVKKYRK